ncbi:hypothetical protein HAP94_07525 [Acidithiobacillus ferrivorans]|nr:hypothetical protein [Acidithiobacillus ferrivorans]
MADVATFSELVREAFIDPLRSVLIVDDQYPTWEEILNSKIEGGEKDEALEVRSAKKDWTTQPSEPLKVIREFRSNKPGFVIDIHDALAPTAASLDAGAKPQESASELADHLHQSDLLVLDYNLEGEAGGLRGKKAREILRLVLKNNHFNLIIVHTGENDLDEVMEECLLSVMQSCSSEFIKKILDRLDELDTLLDPIIQVGDFDPEHLGEKFGLQEYLKVRQDYASIHDAVASYMRGEGVFTKLKELGQTLTLSGVQLSTFLFWAVRELEKKKSSEFDNQTAEGLSWKNDANCKWMRTSRGFVTFVKKGPENLLGELQKALENWQPTPSRLLSAKYRHALNRIGVEAEDKSLLNAHVFAQFYDSILEPAREGLLPAQAALSRGFKLKEHVSRQSEAISFLIEDEVVRFGEKIVLADEAAAGAFAAHYGIDLNNEAIKKAAINQYNSYVSTLPMKPGSDQLDSGHIFQLGDEWWLCATPACDLQPGQNTIAFTGTSDELRPFTALLLVRINLKDLENGHINSGSYCFVQNGEEVICLGLRSTSDERKPATQKETWRTFLALSQGLITDGRLRVLQPRLAGSKLETQEAEGVIVAKLRYEYALSYIQRVGASVSRIGLGYAAYPKK